MSEIEIGSIPANGSSSSMIEGSAASARAISQRRRSPPDSAIAGAVAQMRDVEFVRAACRAARRRRGLVGVSIQLQHRGDVLRDGETAEDRGLLREIAEPEDRAAVHRQPGDVLAVEQDAARVRLHQPHHRIEAGGLARAIRAEQPDHLAARDLQADVGQHLAAIIGLGDRDDRRGRA